MSFTRQFHIAGQYKFVFMRLFILLLLFSLTHLSILRGQNSPVRNGFKLEKLRIPLNEIRAGGPPKDGIPAIDDPSFESGSKANLWLNEEDYVLGIFFNGIAKAYPIRIMDQHEVVNDDFGGKPVLVTYCPLCGSGVAFDPRIGEKVYSFGVSGLLYNSDVLLYDRQTESLWSQIKSEAISGPLSGEQIELIPVVFEKWTQWRYRYSKTLVLSRETGFNRNYSRKAYASYEENDRLMFPVAKNNGAFPNKEKVLGICINGKYKAYPFSELKKGKRSVEDQFEGQTLQIVFDKGNETGRILDMEGQELPAISLYWFAWYAFHPETEVWERG